MPYSRELSIVALAILVLAAGAYLAPKALPTVAPARATPRTISLVAYYPNWNVSNPTIIVTKGDSVSITVSDGGDYYSHQLLIDFDGDGVSDVSDCGTNDQCSGFVTSSSSSTIPTFTVNTAGNFSYYCTVHHPPLMTGTFEVKNPTQPPSPDYSVSSNPSSLTILKGTNANTTVTVSSLNHFNGTITLSAISSPTGPTATFQTNPVTITSGGPATSKLTIAVPSNIPAGSYSLTVNGSNSTTTRSATISVTVPAPDFSISSNPTTITVVPGSSATTTVTVTSVNGFVGSPTLGATVSPSGPHVTISPTSVTLTAGGMASATLTVNASGVYATSTPAGTYTVTITATNSSLSHSSTVSLTVGSASPTGSASLPIGLLVGGAVGVIVVIGAAVYLVRRRAPGKV